MAFSVGPRRKSRNYDEPTNGHIKITNEKIEPKENGVGVQKYTTA